MDASTDPVLRARAAVLRDLTVTGAADAAAVSALETSCRERAEWLGHWAEGEPFITGLVAQDVQDALHGAAGRWPLCPRCEVEHALYVEPDLGGPDPTWVCEEQGLEIAPVGGLS